MTSQDPTVLHIQACISDGVETARPSPARGCSPCDQYFKIAIARMWAKDRRDLDVNDSTDIVLDKLPDGYAGFQKARQSKAGHIDRWVYGHKNGYFDSTVKFYTHFKHLMDHGNNKGCRCVRCATSNPSNAATSNQAPLSSHLSNAQLSGVQSPPSVQAAQTNPTQATINPGDNTATNLYARITSQVSKLGKGALIDRVIDERAAYWPFNTSNHSLHSTFDGLVRLPAYLHRAGEVVLFHSSTGQSTWGAGLVVRSSFERGQAVVHLREVTQTGAGLVVAIQSQNTLPFSDWKQATSGTGVGSSQGSVRAALNTAAGVSAVSPFRVRASSVDDLPTATVQCRGIYMAHELILPGDLVYLSSNYGRNEGRNGVEAHWNGPLLLHISQVKLRLVNFTLSRCNVCIHITGRVYSQDPTDSFGGHGKAPLRESNITSPGHTVQGDQLYHVLDPAQPRLRLQVPFNRILRRYRGNHMGSDAAQAIRSSDETERKSWAWAESRLRQLGLLEHNVR